MRSISKFEHCYKCAKKCLKQAECMTYAMFMAPSKQDFNTCARKQGRAVKHYLQYKELMNFYGGNQ